MYSRTTVQPKRFAMPKKKNSQDFEKLIVTLVTVHSSVKTKDFLGVDFVGYLIGGKDSKMLSGDRKLQKL